MNRVAKRVNGKLQGYKNLAAFHKECPKRSVKGNICLLSNIRKTKSGGGLATVRSQPGFTRARPAGTWLLRFESYELLKRDLQGRVEARVGLGGTRRRRRR